MSEKRLPIPNDNNQEELQGQIEILQQELEHIQKETLAFETLLRSHLSDLIVEAQELFVLYKQIKKAKNGAILIKTGLNSDTLTFSCYMQKL